ncbi:MAG: pyridoxamine 5'-phosphate oxidase family protein [Hyphomicrobiaceae bacterium]
MTTPTVNDLVTTDAELDAIYGAPVPAAVIKEIDHIAAPYRGFIEKAPFVVIATVGPEGLDCSPRGDPAGFVRIADEKTVMIPDRRGNNRIDGLRNLIRDPRISLLFMIPGLGNTFRINGRAVISADPTLRESFAINGKVPATVLIVTVERCYFQCPKALIRSRLWDPTQHVARDALPSTGEILETLSRGNFDGKSYDAAYPKRLEETIY